MPSRDWNLSEVRIYRGLPDSTKDSKGYAAARRQISAWERDPITRVFGRALRYPQGWPGVKAQEKGIDVALAVDFVVMAVRDEYDIGIIMSSDTDLIPALEGVFALNPPRPIPEVAAWTSPTGYSSRLRVRGEKVVCHWLDASDYAAVADPRDYNVVTRASGV